MSQPAIQIEERGLNQNLSSLRKRGIIPGIMYGQSLKQSIPIQISLIDLQKMITNPSKLTRFPITLHGEVKSCILREFQTDRMHSEILHVDFQYVKDGEIVKMPIPISYEGLEFLRSKKLLVEKAIDKLPVSGLVHILPDTFMIDVKALDRGAKIFAKDIPLPKTVEMFLHPDTILATVQ